MVTSFKDLGFLKVKGLNKNIKNISFSKNLEESEQAAKNSLCLPLYYDLSLEIMTHTSMQQVMNIII